MKNTNILDVGKGLAIGLIIAIIFLLLRGCQSETPAFAKTIQTKEVKGKFKPVKPKQLAVSTEPKKTSAEPKYRTSDEDKFLQGQIDVLIAENKALQQYYNEASDSLKQALYNKAIEIKSFNQDFEDDKLKITTSGLVRGEIQSLKLDYTIKPQIIELPRQKETFLRVLVGGGLGINKELNQPVWKANLGFQNRKGNIVKGSFQKIGNQDYFMAEYDFSIFNWKR
jgi:hypothetical protein